MVSTLLFLLSCISFKYVSLVALVSEFHDRCFLRSRCSMELWCPDDIGRDSWDWATYLGDSTIQLPRVGWRLLACENGASPDRIIVVVVVVVVVVVGLWFLTRCKQRRVCPGHCTHAPNCGDHVPVDMTSRPCTQVQGPKKLTLNLANAENRPLESSPPARELGRETRWAT